MSFSNLTYADKEAFFALLDEYFSSRPDLLPGVAGGGAGAGTGAGGIALNASNGRAAVSAAQTALAHPGVHDAVSKWSRPSPDAAQAGHDAGVPSGAGRVAAAAAALRSSGFSMGQNAPAASPPPAPAPGPSPRPPPRRSPSMVSSASEESAPHHEANKLVPNKKFGDVDMSSGKAMFSSLRSSTANKAAAPPQVAPPTPSAFQPRRGQFAPPPRRTSVPDQPPPAPPVNRRPAAQPEEPEGEWAEALYDYTSEDPGDLPIEAGDRVLVVQKESDDWWTAEIDGRRGLVPAAYVKML